MVDRETRVQEFRSDLEADLASVESEIDSHKLELDRLSQEREALQQLIGEANRFLSSISGDSGHSGTVERISPRAGNDIDPVPSQKNISTANGLSKNLTRRQIVMQIVPDFHGTRFKSGDIRHRFVRDYLDGVEPPNFPQAINNLLKRMAEKGEIQDLGRDENGPSAPRYYREINNQEENLLGP